MKKYITFFAVAIIIAGASFYGGMKYDQTTRQNFVRQNFGGRELGASAIGGGQRGGGFISGEIIAKDDKSITVKLQDGGSKIIFFSDSTEISKTIKGSIDDIEIGKQIMVSGGQNPDGSYTAKTIQER